MPFPVRIWPTWGGDPGLKPALLSSGPKQQLHVSDDVMESRRAEASAAPPVRVRRRTNRVRPLSISPRRKSHLRSTGRSATYKRLVAEGATFSLSPDFALARRSISRQVRSCKVRSPAGPECQGGPSNAVNATQSSNAPPTVTCSWVGVTHPSGGTVEAPDMLRKPPGIPCHPTSLYRGGTILRGRGVSPVARRRPRRRSG